VRSGRFDVGDFVLGHNQSLGSITIYRSPKQPQLSISTRDSLLPPLSMSACSACRGGRSFSARRPKEGKPTFVDVLVGQIAEGRGIGFGVTSSPQEIEAGTLESLRSAVALLREKAPDELDAYRSFVLEPARSVASAARAASRQKRQR
jgi:hypothetical protein